MSSRYWADNFTGANVSLFIGDSLLTQAFGISWNLQEEKRPIYGYNSVYFDGIADGQVIVAGQLYLNFVFTNYLSTVLQRYWSFKNGLEAYRQEGGRADDLLSYVNSRENIVALSDLIRETLDAPVSISGRETYSPVGLVAKSNPTDNSLDYTTRPASDGTDMLQERRFTRYKSNSERQRTLDEALNSLFDDETTRQSFIEVFTGGLVKGYEENENGVRLVNARLANENSIVERSLNRTQAAMEAAIFARPGQMTSSLNGFKGIDILVRFGPPYDNINQNQVINYSNTSSFVLKDVHFIGESGQILMDDSPAMETYNFIARKKETVSFIE